MWPLVARDRELGSVDELLSRDSVRGVVLAGPAGVGKTRLATEMSRVASSRGCAVEWVRATGSAASIALGAFAALLPAPGIGSADRADPLARARLALVERAAGRRLVLCVDDGQLRLLGLVLGGPVEGRSANALWELMQGNPLFLRELVLQVLERAFLTDEGGIWRWRGAVTAGVRLAELIGARPEALGAQALGVLEIVAVGAPLEVGFLDPEELALLGALELQAAVQRGVDGRRRFVDVAYPLHAEVVRAPLSRTRLEAIQGRLADARIARRAPADRRSEACVVAAGVGRDR